MDDQATSEVEDKKDEPLFPFIKRDPNERNTLHVEHKEARGVFVMRKPTFSLRGELGRVKSAFLGPMPDTGSEVDGELFATAMVSFEKTPAGFNPEEIVSFKLLEGLYSEVNAYWGTFRD